MKVSPWFLTLVVMIIMGCQTETIRTGDGTEKEAITVAAIGPNGGIRKTDFIFVSILVGAFPGTTTT